VSNPQGKNRGDCIAAPVLDPPTTSKKPLPWHLMREHDGLVTFCGVRFDPDKPSHYSHSPDGSQGVDCVVCADLYKQGWRTRGY
jgi:hypothetical protein